MNRIFIDDCAHWLGETDYPLEEGYDLVYIDPPYDTGTKFSYHDKRVDWVPWMTGLMTDARRIMRDDGALFISIDDNRLIELCVLCDSIFGKQNRLAIMVTHQSQRSNAKHINVVHEYVVAYAKDKRRLPALSVPRRHTRDARVISELDALVRRELARGGQEEAQRALRRRNTELRREGVSWTENYRFVDGDGRIYYAQDLSVPGEPNEVDIPEIGLHLDPLPTRKWSSPQKIRRLHDAGLIEFLNGRPYEKHYLSDARDSISSILPFYSRQGTEELKRLGCGGLFDTPKPPAMIELFVLAVAASRKRVRVLDFFGGSGTTAQAVWQAQDKLGDGCELSFDLVQKDEAMREGTRPYRTALRLHIEPRIPNALLYRLESFWQIRAMESLDNATDCQYEVIRVGTDEASEALGDAMTDGVSDE